MNDVINSIKEKIVYIEKKINIQKLNDELKDIDKKIDEINTSYSKELVSLLKQKSKIEKTLEDYKDLNLEVEILSEYTLKELEEEKESVNICLEKAENLYIQTLFNPEDDKSCYLYLQAGAGGVESCDWVSILLRMYTRFCEKYDLKCIVVDMVIGEEAGYKSCVLHVKGEYAYGLLNYETGVHRLVRMSPFNAAGKRMTSFASVLCYPEVDTLQVKIDSKDLRIDTYKSSGAGGQHVNTTDSAVRITHLPSGIVVQSQGQRSQHQNKETCMKMLYSRLKLKQDEDNKNNNAIDKNNIGWGSQIRSYVLQPYKMIKELRVDYKTSNTDKFLDGDIMKCIISLRSR